MTLDPVRVGRRIVYWRVVVDGKSVGAVARTEHGFTAQLGYPLKQRHLGLAPTATQAGHIVVAANSIHSSKTGQS